MKMNPNRVTPKAELEASLERLGIRELEERMEVSPLLIDTGIAGTTATDPDTPSVCCTCKIPGPDGTLPYPKIDLNPTGPTNPNGFF
jgi:hypothetical protein